VVYSAADSVPLALALPAGILAGAACSVFCFEVVRGIRARDVALTSAVATLALAILIQQLIRITWGSTQQNPFPTPFGLSAETIGDVSITHLTLASVGVAAGLALAVGAALRWTRVGTMIRAIADNPTSAALCGGNVHVLLAGVWAVGGGLAAVAGFFAAQIVFFPSFLDPFFVAALIAAVLGGLRSLTAAFVGALTLEVGRNLFEIYAPSSYFPYAQTVLVLVLIAVLVLAPRRWLARGVERLV
jgi:branched-chain amino acid transport system permease protein